MIVDPEIETSKVTPEDLFDRLVIYSSDFSRARQTAAIFKATVSALLRSGIPLLLFNNLVDLESQNKEECDADIPLFETDKLRERYFGKYWEGKSNQHYNEVWQHDIDTPETENNTDDHFSGNTF